MAERVPQHAHCWVCGRAIKLGEKKTCGAECQEQHEAQQKKRRTMMYILYGAMAATILLILVGALQGA